MSCTANKCRQGREVCTRAVCGMATANGGNVIDEGIPLPARPWYARHPDLGFVAKWCGWAIAICMIAGYVVRIIRNT